MAQGGPEHTFQPVLHAIKAMNSPNGQAYLLKMSLIPVTYHKHHTKRNKKRLNHEQVMLLESSFNHDKKLQPDRKIQLAQYLGLHPHQVAVWYQNKRARWKTQMLECDYKAISQRLESVSAEKTLLEKEVERLRGELDKAQGLLRSNIHPFSSFSPSCDEEWSSTLERWINSSEENVEVQVEELYSSYGH